MVANVALPLQMPLHQCIDRCGTKKVAVSFYAFAHRFE
jgi:hypothetical protein